jgi:hypothetical protein
LASGLSGSSFTILQFCFISSHTVSDNSLQCLPDKVSYAVIQDVTQAVYLYLFRQNTRGPYSNL